MTVPVRSCREVGGAWRQGLIMGVINGALPFTLIAWGEKHIDSGVAAIANASVPIFVAILAVWFNPAERSSGLKLAGILVGLLGVGVLAGVNPDGGGWAVLGTLAVVLASLSYAAGGLYGQHAVRSASGPVLATARRCSSAGWCSLPFALFQLPDHAPGWKPVGSLIALAVVGTAIAQLVLFRMLRMFGAARLSLVTYLMPVTALIYGSLILDEPLRPSMLVGLGLILGGVALGSGSGAQCAGRSPIRREDEAEYKATARLSALVRGDVVTPKARAAPAGRRRLPRRAPQARRGRAVPLGARRQRDREDVLELIGRSQREPDRAGLFVIEVDGERAGTMEFEAGERRSRIACLGGLARPPSTSAGVGSPKTQRASCSGTCSSTWAFTGCSSRSTGSTSGRSATPSASGSSARV